MGETSVQNVTPRILTFIPRSERWLKDSTPVAHHKPVAYFLTIYTIPVHIIFLYFGSPILDPRKGRSYKITVVCMDGCHENQLCQFSQDWLLRFFLNLAQ